MKTPILSVKNLDTEIFVYGAYQKVVDDISFDLYAGKTLAIVGESGSGKTMVAQSILRIIAQELRPRYKGQIIFKDSNILKMREKELQQLRGSSLGFIMQNAQSSLNPVYTIYNQLEESLKLRYPNLSDDECEVRILEALNFVGLKDGKERMHDYPHQFSGGMKQRAIIAMALLQDPAILIADEPTTALDVTVQKQILELLKKIQREKALSILLISHDMGIVSSIANEVMVMYSSQLMEKSTINSLLGEAKHPYSQALFNARPSLKRPVTNLEAIKGSLPSLKDKPEGCLFHPRCKKVMPECTHSSSPNLHYVDGHQVRCRLYD